MITKEAKAAREKWVKAMIKCGGHYHNEFQEARNKTASNRVFDRNLAAVKEAAKGYLDAADEEIKVLEEMISRLKIEQHYAREATYSPNPIYSYSLDEFISEIPKGIEEYGDDYYDRKWKREDKRRAEREAAKPARDYELLSGIFPGAD